MPGIGIHISPMFSRSGGGAASVLQPWYDSLSVKPSTGLWADLKTMADGMNTDGDWSEADLISLLAGLETDEQRLRPLKTTSGLDFLKVGTPTLNNDGLKCNGTSNYLRSQWKALINGVKFDNSSLLYATIACYQTSYSGSTTTTQMVNIGAKDFNVSSGLNTDTKILKTVVGGVTDTLLNGSRLGGFIGGGNTTIGNGSGKSYDALTQQPVDIGSGNNPSVLYKNGLSNTVTVLGSDGGPAIEFYVGAYNNDGVAANFSNKTIGFCLAGGNVNHDNVKSRLDVFFHNRGVTTF